MAAVLAVGGARAQAKQFRIGILHPLPLSGGAATAVGLLERLAELGYRDGGTMKLEYRVGGDTLDGYPKAARELVDAKCDVVFAIGPEATVRALQDARGPMPIVFIAIDYDPVEKGIVANLRQPDRSTTGIFVPQNALVAKRFEVLREALPRARNFLVLSDVHSRDQVAAAQAAAEASGVRMTLIEFSNPPYDFAPAFAAARKARADGMVVLNSPVFFPRQEELAALQIKHRLPAIVGSSTSAAAGYLFGLAPDPVKTTRRAAQIAVRILKGAKPADIPVEQADQFELVVNLKTAKALGVKIPSSVMARATRLIE
jgi:putative ABC transport system substrate-binding protein